MAAKFVKELQAAGHNVHYASITHGAEDTMANSQAGLDPESYLKMRDEYEKT